MTQTVVGLFHAPAEAEHAIADLVHGGFRREQIKLVGPDRARAAHVTVEGSAVEHAEDMVIGAVAGGLLGALLGTIIGMIALALPGIGPVVAASSLAGAVGAYGASMVLGGLAGALLGGFLGARTWASITADQAHRYEAFVDRGGVLVMVRAASAERERAAEILHHDGALSAGELEAERRRDGLL